MQIEKCILHQIVLERPNDILLCEDPELIGAWFRLVDNMRTKYGVLDCDFYNFDETGFMMGIITPRMVVTRADRRSRSKAVQPGNTFASMAFSRSRR
jgi:RecB family endonuclease NucS